MDFMPVWIAGLVLILTGPAAAEPVVSDGDTLTVDGTKYRLDGIDAPEFNQVCLDDKGQKWDCGLAARDALANLIANRAVHCEDKGPDKVHPDRRIGICTCGSEELNKWLVREGWALNFEPYAKGRFLPAQADAAKNRRGIWKGCFAAPTDWRHWKKEGPSMGSTCPRDAAERIFGCRIKGNQRSKKYHHPGCPSYDSISGKNVVKLFCSEDEARSEGYTKAGNCPP
jgi:endonuclease YncB( thermonuclease family)